MFSLVSPSYNKKRFRTIPSMRRAWNHFKVLRYTLVSKKIVDPAAFYGPHVACDSLQQFGSKKTEGSSTGNRTFVQAHSSTVGATDESCL